MNGYLIDTNVISEFIQPQPAAQVIRWFHQVSPSNLYASVMTLGEIRLGIEKLPESKRRSALENWLQTGLPIWFASNLLPVSSGIADRWGKLTIQARRRGMMLTTTDGLIAATALEHDLTLVTRNVKDFAVPDLVLLNPWTA